MALARQKGDAKVGAVARDALANARRARLENERLRGEADLRKRRAEIALANVRNLLAEQTSTSSKISSVVTDYTGRTSIYSKSLGKIIPLEGGRADFLGPGDTITTYGNSIIVTSPSNLTKTPKKRHHVKNQSGGPPHFFLIDLNPTGGHRSKKNEKTAGSSTDTGNNRRRGTRACPG